MRKLKRAIVKEELVALTGDIESALILNQFLYWSERVRDFDRFIREEAEIRLREDMEAPNIKPRNGWIYKDMEELKSEIMLSSSTVTIGRKLSKIVENGWLDRRTNPDHKWDKRYQYRVNLNKIALDLHKIGYTLQDYKIDIKPLISSNLQNEDSSLHSEESNLQNEASEIQNEASEIQNEASNFHNEEAISEITTEITTEIINNNSTKILSNLEGTPKQNETIKEDVVVNNINQIPKEDIKKSKDEIQAAYEELGVANDIIIEILGDDPSEEDINRMKSAIDYVKSEYIAKNRRINNLPGLIRSAYEQGYKREPVDSVKIKNEKRLAREREEWKKEMSKPKASPEVVKRGLETMRSILIGEE